VVSNWLVAIVGGAIATIVGGVALYYILPSQQAADSAPLTIASNASSVTLRCERTADCENCFEDVVIYSIQRGWFTKPSMTRHFKGGTQSTDIVESSATHYRAESKDKKATLELDRVGGGLSTCLSA
jgi:hypothetical protein